MGNKWTDDEIDILVENYSITNNNELVELFSSRTLTSVKNKAKRLNLKKNKITEFKNRSAAHCGEKNGMYGKRSIRNGKTYEEYYGDVKANTIKRRLSENRQGNDGLIGVNNGMYGKTPWNKGVTASDELRMKYKIAQKRYWDNLSNLELKERKDQLRKDWIIKRNRYSEIDTIPEKITENLLIELNILYEKKKNIGYYNCDFVINNKIIEVQGDYWHANPKIYETHDNIQKKNYERDMRKSTFLKGKNYKILYLWECDLKNNHQMCRLLINNHINNG